MGHKGTVLIGETSQAKKRCWMSSSRSEGASFGFVDKNMQNTLRQCVWKKFGQKWFACNEGLSRERQAEQRVLWGNEWGTIPLHVDDIHERATQKNGRGKNSRLLGLQNDTSTIYLAIRTIAMKRRVQRPVTDFALVAWLMESLITRSRNNHDAPGDRRIVLRQSIRLGDPWCRDTFFTVRRTLILKTNLLANSRRVVI